MIINQEGEQKLPSPSSPRSGPRKGSPVVPPITVNRAMIDADSVPPPPYSSIREAPLPPLPSTSFTAPEPQMPVPEPAPFTRFSPFQPLAAQHVNHICLFSKHNTISGTYYVDPVVPGVTPTLNKSDRMQRDAARAHHKNAKRAFGSWDVGHDSDRSRCSKRKPQEINASFRTHHGAVTLDVAVVGTGSGSSFISKEEKIPARVMASSRHGRVNVNLFEIHPDRCVDLDVSTRHGAITVFLPPTFNGPIAFRTRRGREGITFLPEMARRTSIVRASDSEVLVVLTNPDAERESASTSHMQFQRTAGGDCALIGTRHGKVLVGISGVDQLDTTVAPPGLFKKLGGLIESKVNTFVQTHAKQLEARMLGLHDRPTLRGAVIARAMTAIS